MFNCSPYSPADCALLRTSHSEKRNILALGSRFKPEPHQVPCLVSLILIICGEAKVDG